MKHVLWLLLASASVLAQESAPPAVATDAATPPLSEPTAVPLQTPAVTPVVVPATPAPSAPVSAPAPVPAPPLPPPTRVTAPPVPDQLEPAGRWAGDFGAGVTLSAGNTDGQSFNLSVDTTYTRPDDKLTLFGNYLESRARTEANGVVTTSITARRGRVGTRYDRNLSEDLFGFVGLEFNHDRARDLDLRTLISTGLGRHIYKDAELSWDVYAGLSWREDYYRGEGVAVNGVLRTRDSAAETLFGQESTYQFSGTTRFTQKLVLYPGLGQGRGTRATLDGALLVDLNETLVLTMRLQGRYDNQSPPPAKNYDLSLITGLGVRFGR